MKKLLTLSMLAASFAANAQFRADIVTERPENKLKKAMSNFTFNYYAKYLGPSLSNDLKNGATFNRFETGQTNTTRKDLDFRGSEQIYQSFKLGLRLPNNMILSYGVTFQDNLNSNVEYTYTNWDNSQSVYKRVKGRSQNNHRASLWIPGIYSNNLFYIGASVYYERPTTDASQEADMRYGAGIQPSVGFFSSVPGLFYGFGVSLERDFYDEYHRMPDWCKEPGYTCEGVYPIVNRQVFRASVSPYLNYYLSDKVLLKTSLSFDWDQMGNQLGTTKLNNNMDDVASAALSYMFNNNVNVSAGVEASISNPDLDRTALFGTLGLNI